MLHVVLAAPFAAAALLFVSSGRDGRSAFNTAILLAAAIFGITLPLLAGPMATAPIAWFPIPGTKAIAHYALVADGLAAWMVVLSSLLTLATLLAVKASVGDRMREFAGWVFLLEGALFGSFLASDAILFFLFFEAMVAPAAFLIASFGGPGRKRASLLFAIFTLAGSAPMAVALWCVVAWGGTSNGADVAAALASVAPEKLQYLFFGFAIAFAVKTPLFPVHGWQADSYAEAPPALGALLSGAMAKVGLFGFLRWTLPLFPAAAQHNSKIFIVLGLITVVYGSLVAMRQNEIRRVLAFSSLGHLGLGVAGIFTMHAGAWAGVVALMVSHGLSAGALFLLAGLPERWAKNRQISAFGGMAASSPVFSFLFMVASMASVAVPGTLGFVGEFLILQGLWQGVGALYAIIGGLCAILSAAYTLRLVQQLLFGKPAGPGVPAHNGIAHSRGEVEHEDHGHSSHATPAFEGGAEASVSEALAVAPLLLLLILLGFHPDPVLKAAAPSEEAAVAFAQNSQHENPQDASLR